MKIFNLLIFTFLACICTAQENTGGLSSAIQEPVFKCPVSDIAITNQGNAITALAFPANSTVMSSFLLSGSGLYEEIRIVILAFKLLALDNNDQVNESCLECYDFAGSWLSITEGRLQDFNPIVSSMPNTAEAPETANPREIIFIANDPISIDDLALEIYFNLPGINPLEECVLQADFYLQLTFKDSEFNECDLIVPVSARLTLSTTPFTLLKDKPDGFYYPAFKGAVNFKYDVPYNVIAGKKLSYVVYDKENNPVNIDLMGNLMHPMPIVNLKSGTNYVQIDFSHLETMTKNQFYTLEVVSVNNEKSYLRFLFLE